MMKTMFWDKKKSGAKVKGWIKNNVTNAKSSFLFNPTELAHGRGANYCEITSPGMSYPLHQYISGTAREFSVDLFLYDKPCTDKIQNQITFIESCLPPETNVEGYTKPPEITFCLGTFVKKCVILDYQVKVHEWNSSGRMTQASITLKLKQVGA